MHQMLLMLLENSFIKYSIFMLLTLVSCKSSSEELETIDVMLNDKYEYIENRCDPCIAFESKAKEISNFFNAEHLSGNSIDELFISDALKDYVKKSTFKNDKLKSKQLELLCLNDFELKCKDFSFYVDLMQAYVRTEPPINSLNIGDTAKIIYGMLVNNSLNPFEVNVNEAKYKANQSEPFITSDFVISKDVDTIIGHTFYFSHGDTTRFDFLYPINLAR